MIQNALMRACRAKWSINMKTNPRTHLDDDARRRPRLAMPMKKTRLYGTGMASAILLVTILGGIPSAAADPICLYSPSEERGASNEGCLLDIGGDENCAYVIVTGHEWVCATAAGSMDQDQCWWPPPGEVQMCQYTALPEGTGRSGLFPGDAAGNWGGVPCAWLGLGGSCTVLSGVGVPMGEAPANTPPAYTAITTATAGGVSISAVAII